MNKNKLVILFAGSFCSFLLITHLYSYRDGKNAHDRQNLHAAVMRYNLADPIERCKKEGSYTDEDMQILEREFKRYLILAHEGYMVPMYSKDVDNLWHAFILFTKEYHQFCKKHFGRYLHHAPRTSKSPKETREESRKKLREFILRYEELFNERIHPIWLLDTFE